jgi:hypothetical protein
MLVCINTQHERQSRPTGTVAFDSEMLVAARIYQVHLAHGRTKSYMPLEVAAFIAGACWAKQFLLEEGKDK